MNSELERAIAESIYAHVVAFNALVASLSDRGLITREDFVQSLRTSRNKADHVKVSAVYAMPFEQTPRLAKSQINNYLQAKMFGASAVFSAYRKDGSKNKIPEIRRI